MAGDYDKAQSLAHEYLALAADHPNNWNHGNAIHLSNIILGRIALVQGDIQAAQEHLLMSGQINGSPQLNSFGPNMSLARDLLTIGRQEVVLTYLDLISRFWYKLFSFFKVRKWRRVVKRGEIPDFGANLQY